MKPAAERHRSAARLLDDAVVAHHQACFTDAAHGCPTWEPERLPERTALTVSAIVEECSVTTVVLPGWRGAPDEHADLRPERSDHRTT